MSDVQVLAPGSKAAPLDYVIPGAQEIVLKTLFASFNGAAAAAAWYPAIQLIAPGNVLAGTFKTRSSVAAGGSADVTFGPFLDEDPAATPAAAVSLPLAQASDFSTTITSGATVTMSLADWFGTTDASYYGTQVVGGKTYMQVKKAGMYRAIACCIAADTVDTGPLVLSWFWNFGTGTVDVTELDAGQQSIGQITYGGLNRWLVTSSTYFGIDHPGSTAVTIKINGANLTGNLSTQHTDIILVREGDYVANVLL